MIYNVFQINIASAVRTQLTDIFEGDEFKPETNANVSECERIMPLMEEACEQISRLMLDSYYRFRRTQEFAQLIDQESGTFA